MSTQCQTEEGKKITNKLKNKIKMKRKMVWPHANHIKNSIPFYRIIFQSSSYYSSFCVSLCLRLFHTIRILLASVSRAAAAAVAYFFLRHCCRRRGNFDDRECYIAFGSF